MAFCTLDLVIHFVLNAIFLLCSVSTILCMFDLTLYLFNKLDESKPTRVFATLKTP